MARECDSNYSPALLLDGRLTPTNFRSVMLRQETERQLGHGYDTAIRGTTGTVRPVTRASRAWARSCPLPVPVPPPVPDSSPCPCPRPIFSVVCFRDRDRSPF